MTDRPGAGRRAAATARSIVVAALVAVGCSGAATPATSPPASTAQSAASPSARPTAAAPTVGPIGSACLTNGEQAATVTFSSSSGVPLGGVVLGTGRMGVVLAHEALGNLCEWMPFARHLAATG